MSINISQFGYFGIIGRQEEKFYLKNGHLGKSGCFWV